MKTFISQFRLGKSLEAFDQSVVKNEPMFFNASPAFARQHGGPITQDFLDKLPDNVEIIDTRVHMLMPGWFPSIPGWHHDDVPRERTDGQPEYDNPSYRSKHIMALVNGDICPTEFAVGYADMPEVPLGETIYKVWHPRVEELINQKVLTRVKAPSNTLIWFDDETFHQGARAVGGGFRWFGRASYNTGRKPTNEIRRQVNVYLDAPMEGW